MTINKTVRVGMVGAGQLARMTHQAAIDLGINFVVLAQSPLDPAVLSGAEAIYGNYRDPSALLELAGCCDVITFDHELVPYDLLRLLEKRSFTLRPGAKAFMYSQDKLYARVKFSEAGFSVPEFAPLGEDIFDGIIDFADAHSWPVVVKSRSGGYDGRGVWVIHDETEARAFCDRFLKTVTPEPEHREPHPEKDYGQVDKFIYENKKYQFIVEEHVEIQKEIAILGVRRPGGDFVTYAPIETVQRNGICNELFMPADIPDTLANIAKETAARIAELVGVVGLIAVEMFVDQNSHLVINELALRPHNSGHATIEAAYTSQFQNHLRAVLDWPLGSADMKVNAAAMVNILGGEALLDPRQRLGYISQYPTLAVHLYAKEPVLGRKLGHVTAIGGESAELLALAKSCAEELTSPQ
ncbi:MAG: ATP-grasp domain-containing protein [Firmicutes bacterium]|nr:ATP-grasp domain-containing protein [Bacillota bacterium]